MIRAGCRLRGPLVLLVGLFAASVLVALPARGQTSESCAQAVLTPEEVAALLRVDVAEVTRLAEQGAIPARRLESSWRFSCAAVIDWLARDRQAQTGAEDQPVGEAPEDRPADEVFLRGQRVLLGPGDVVVDFGQFYARTDDQALVLANGAIGLATVRREVLTTLVQARVGIFDETEALAAVTFQNREERVLLGATDLGGSRRDEFGGATVGVRHTLVREGRRRPNIIVSVDGYVPSGDRAYIVGGGLVLVKSVDPVAVYASAHYFRAIDRDSAASSAAQPDRSVHVSAGYALALNDTLAISMAVSGVSSRTAADFDDARLRSPGTFGARFGLTSWLARGLYLEPSVSFALTGPGRGFSLGVTVPYSF